MKRYWRLAFLGLILSACSDHTPQPQDPVAVAATELGPKRKSFAGTYLETPKGTELLLQNTIQISTLGQTKITGTQAGEARCVLYRRHVDPGVTRLYTIAESTKF